MLGECCFLAVFREIKARTNGMAVMPRRRDITIGADHATDCCACRCRWQLAGLPAYTTERQVPSLAKLRDIGGIAQDHHRCCSDQAMFCVHLPLLMVLAQTQRLLCGLNADKWVLTESMAQRRRVDPACFWVK